MTPASEYVTCVFPPGSRCTSDSTRLNSPPSYRQSEVHPVGGQLLDESRRDHQTSRQLEVDWADEAGELAIERLLHRLIRKVPKTHRYLVSDRGSLVIIAILAARNASVEKLTHSAAA
jgi:hypothetical protein